MVPVYIAEVSPKHIRGRMISLQQWAITWGILIQYFIQYGASNVDGGPENETQSTAAFRIPWGIQIVPGAIYFVGLFFYPKSPRWLASKDRWDECMQVLARLHGNGDISHPKVLAEYKEIQDALALEREQNSTSYEEFMKPRIAKRVFLGMSLQMWSQLCGMNVMMYYIVYIMQSTGAGSPLLTASIQYILNTALTLPAILWLDRFGRRPAILIGFTMQAIFLYVEGGLQAGYGRTTREGDANSTAISWTVADHPAVGRAIIAMSYLFVCSFATTIGPTSWTYPAEIYPAKVRAKAVSLATASNWTWNCLLALFVPPLLWSINWKMYMIVCPLPSTNPASLLHEKETNNTSSPPSTPSPQCTCSSQPPRQKASPWKKWTKSSTAACPPGAAERSARASTTSSARSQRGTSRLRTGRTLLLPTRLRLRRVMSRFDLLSFAFVY